MRLLSRPLAGLTAMASILSTVPATAQGRWDDHDRGRRDDDGRRDDHRRRPRHALDVVAGHPAGRAAGRDLAPAIVGAAQNLDADAGRQRRDLVEADAGARAHVHIARREAVHGQRDARHQHDHRRERQAARCGPASPEGPGGRAESCREHPGQAYTSCFNVTSARRHAGRSFAAESDEMLSVRTVEPAVRAPRPDCGLPQAAASPKPKPHRRTHASKPTQRARPADD